EEGMTKAKIGQKLDLLHQTLRQVVNAKEELLKEITSATPLNIYVIRKWNNFTADTEKVLVVWREDQTSHNMPLNRSLTQGKALTLFNSVEAKRGTEATEEKFEASRGWF
ncbi:hypothetical protein PANDA_000339, partial [Ailuropoda melanoleuca]